MALENLLGKVLVNKSKTEVPTSSVTGAGKVVALYFSAHWCPPCRAFTPTLVKFWQDWKQGPRANLFDIVFVSSDRDDEQFEEYFAEMPFLAVPYVDRSKKADLSRKFKVSGIPSLVFLDGETGKMITSEGRRIITEDSKGEDFPWKPKAMREYLGSDFITKTGEKVPLSALEGKIIGLYFSAHWCPPCRSFTPTLVRVYNKLLARGKKLEIVFCSSDHDQETFQSYFDTMPWLALPLNDDRKSALAGVFGVQGIPKLVLIDEKFKTITEDGRMAVTADIDGDDFPWNYKSLNMLKEQYGRTLNEAVCLIYFTDGSDGQIKTAFEALQGLADQVRATAEAQDEDQPLHFFVAGGDEDICDTVIHFLNLSTNRPAVAIMDCGTRSWYYRDSGLSAAELRAWVDDYTAGKLERKVIEAAK